MVGKDFDEVVAFLKKRHLLVSEPTGTFLSTLRRMHSRSYSLLVWRFRCTGLPPRAKFFLDEIASDTIQIIPQALMGYRKPVYLLIRGSIENMLRHIYFSDHEVEFIRTNEEKKWYLSVEDLFEYSRMHPVLRVAEKRFDAINRLRTLYDDLSVGIHGRKVEHLEFRKALADIRFDLDEFKKQQTFLERCSESGNFLLSVFNRSRYRSFPNETKSVISASMSAAARRARMELDV